MHYKDQLIKHGNIMLTATLLSGMFNWGFQFIMVRMLGPADYGILYRLFALFMIVSLSAGPVQTVIAKYISSFKAVKMYGKMSYLLHRTFRRIIICLGVLLLIYFLSSKFIAIFLNIPYITPIIIMGLLLFLSLLCPIGFGAFQGLERFVQLGSLQVLSGFLRISFGVILVWLGLGVSGALLSSFFTSIIIIIAAFWYLNDIWKFRPFDEDIGKANIYKYFFPVAVSYISFAIINYIDPIVVGRYFGKDSLEVGYYSIVSMIGKAFLFLPMSLTIVMFPKVSGQHELGKNTKFLLYKALVYSGLICVLGITICVFFPKLIISILMKRVDITPEAMVTMVPLFRLIGFAVTPYGLISMVINYHLARHNYNFIPYLILGVILQITLFILFHSTLIHILLDLLAAGLFIFILCFFQPGFIIDKLTKRR